MVAHRRASSIAMLWLAGVLPCVAAQAQPGVSPMQGRALVDVLAEYQADGYQILYSTGLVTPSLRIPHEPASDDPISRLQGALNALGLALKAGSSGTWLVTRLPSRSVNQTLTGRVLDAHTGEPLPGVTVQIDGQTLTTDDAGRFVVTVPTRGAAPVKVSREGYQTRQLKPASAIRDLLEISMTPEPPMEEVIVVSSRYALEDHATRSHVLDQRLLDTVPRLGEDPLRVTSHLPGMATIGVSAKPHIRGGSQDELLVLFNNMELLEPFHLRDFRSVFSTFNPSLIESIDVYTGGFPARYGDRMSGVMDIRPTHPDQPFGGELSLSFLNAGLSGFGHFAEGRGSWLASARRGNLDLVTDQINSSVGKPRYSDWLGQVRYAISPRTDIDAGIIAYNDDIELQDFDEDGEIASSRYRNLYGWLQVHRQYAPRLDGSTLIYAGSIRHDRAGILTDEDLDSGDAYVDDQRRFTVAAASQVFRYQHSDRIHAEFGLRLAHQRGRYDYAASIERGALAEFLQIPLTSDRSFQLRPSGSSGGAFGSVRTQLHKRLTLEAGLRWDYQDYTDQRDSQLSPRVSLKYDPFKPTTLRLSAGRFHQPEAIHELQVGDGITGYQPVQYADHIIFGWHQRFADSGWSLRTELYSKTFHDPKRRFENLFNPLVLLPELASDRVEIVPGRARARGMETTLKYQPHADLSAWLTFSHSRVEDRVNGAWQPRAWDQGRTVGAGVSWRNERWSVGAVVLWHDGWRTTRLPAQINMDEPPALGQYGHRLRDYLSLDLQVARSWNWERQSLTVFVELTNLLNRHNVGGIEYDVEELEDESGYEVIANDEPLLPLVPSIGLRWQF